MKRKPTLQHLRVFGSIAYMHIPKQKYRLFDGKKVYESRHVDFKEIEESLKITGREAGEQQPIDGRMMETMLRTTNNHH